MNTATRERRLTRLADYLEELPRTKRFNMGTWGEHHGKHEPAEMNYCGTEACALGHAAMMPEFKRAGLKLEWMHHTPWNGIGAGWWEAEISFKSRMADRAGALFFGLSGSEAYDLFYTQRSKPRVIARLRKLAKLPHDPYASTIEN